MVPQCKVIVFMSTCKQVRFVYEALRRLRPGVPLRALHGKMKQMKRLAAFYDFCEVRCPASPLHAKRFTAQIAPRYVAGHVMAVGSEP